MRAYAWIVASTVTRAAPAEPHAPLSRAEAKDHKEDDQAVDDEHPRDATGRPAAQRRGRMTSVHSGLDDRLRILRSEITEHQHHRRQPAAGEPPIEGEQHRGTEVGEELGDRR